MLFKVLREKFINHKGEKIKKDETFFIDETNYNLKSFYKSRVKDGDIKEIVEKTQKDTKKPTIINKTEEK